jgi:DNA-binding PadR family transcriptional regulator
MAALTPAVFHILLALAPGERHGYGILKDVRRQSNDALRLGPGTVYTTLQRLMDAGWVEESKGPARVIDERRKHYRLTQAGRRALEGEVQRMDGLVRTARAQHIRPRPTRG